VDVPWDMAVGGDLAFPQVPGRRTTKTRLVNAYLAELQAAAEVDAALAIAFVRVVGMVDRPEALLRPDRMLRVLRARRGGSAALPDRAVHPRAEPVTEHRNHPTGDEHGQHMLTRR
jgi:hypothetical protein